MCRLFQKKRKEVMLPVVPIIMQMMTMVPMVLSMVGLEPGIRMIKSGCFVLFDCDSFIFNLQIDTRSYLAQGKHSTCKSVKDLKRIMTGLEHANKEISARVKISGFTKPNCVTHKIFRSLGKRSVLCKAFTTLENIHNYTELAIKLPR